MFDRELYKKEYDKDYYINNKERISEYKKQYMKDYNLKNKESIAQKRKELHERDRKKYTEHSQTWRLNNPEAAVLMRAKSGAKKRGLAFDITIEDIIIPSVCPYLGVQITNVVGEGKLPTNASIDRIDNSKGYIKGNVQIISNKANTMKQDATIAELITFARSILEMYDRPLTVCD